MDANLLGDPRGRWRRAHVAVFPDQIINGRDAVKLHGETAHSWTAGANSPRLKNTFAPDCKNEYFTPTTLAGLCRYGFSYDDLPKEGKQMMDEYMKGCRERCSNGGGSWEPKPLLPDGVSEVLAAVSQSAGGFCSLFGISIISRMTRGAEKTAPALHPHQAGR